MARTNGGLIGKRNAASFGKCKVTTFTSNGNICTQANTRAVRAKILAGGAGGNTGHVSHGGGGGGATTPGSGGSGVVILRLLTSDYSGTVSGSPAVTTDGSYTILTYTSSDTYTG